MSSSKWNSGSDLAVPFIYVTPKNSLRISTVGAESLMGEVAI